MTLIEGHWPDRMEAYSSPAVFRLLLWMWLVYDCGLGAAMVLVQLPHHVWNFNFSASSGPLYPSNCCFFAFSFLQGFLVWNVNVSRSVHPLPVSRTCNYTAFNRDSCLAKVSDVTVTMLLQYSRAQLFKMTPARLTPDLISHLRSMQIGVYLPRKRSGRGGRRK